LKRPIFGPHRPGRIVWVGCTVALVLTMSHAAFAKDINANAGTSGFAFLKINESARPVAMGGAFTGLADDESSLFYNPAGIARFEEPRFILGYHNYFEDLQSGLVGYIKPLGRDRALAFHVSYLNYGAFTETDRQGNVIGDFSGGDVVLSTTFAARHDYQFSFGATAKLIHEKIHEYSATGVALDLGARYMSNRERYSFGLMIQNLGTQLSALGEGEKDGLPTQVRAGAAVKPRGLHMLLAGDVIVPFDNDIDFAVGGEYLNFKPLYLRVGWNSFGSNYRAKDSDDTFAGFSAGIGIDYRSLQFSYAYSPAADLGESHRITITGGI